MREGRIILPGEDGPVHDALRHALVETFGGYTATAGYGGWRDADGLLVSEDVTVYDVGVSIGQDWKLHSIAREYGRKAGQEAVYVRDGHGIVQIIPLKEGKVA